MEFVIDGRKHIIPENVTIKLKDDEVVDKYLNLKSADDILINSRNNKIDELLAENKLLHNKLDKLESELQTPRDTKFEENIKLNATIDILLERLKGKSE